MHREEDDFDGQTTLADGAGHFKAAHLRHLYIEDCNVGAGFRDERERLRMVQAQPAGAPPAGQLGRHEDEELVLLAWCEVHVSARALHDAASFWMSASGVDKSQLRTIGRDILLVTGYEPERLRMRLSVPLGVEPRRVSVDAIEHFLIYREHPNVGAIVHIHAWWRDPIASTEVNYPCGTYELAMVEPRTLS